MPLTLIAPTYFTSYRVGSYWPQTKIHYFHLLKWNTLFVSTLHIILDIIYLTYHMNANQKSDIPAPLSNFSAIYTKNIMAVWAKWVRYSVPNNFLNICDRISIFVSLPMLSGSRKPVFTFILQLKIFLKCIVILDPRVTWHQKKCLSWARDVYIYIHTHKQSHLYHYGTDSRNHSISASRAHCVVQ